MYYRIALLIEDAIYQFSLKKNDVITMGSSSKETICVPELDEIIIKFQWTSSPMMKIKAFPFWKKEILVADQNKILEIRKKAAIVVNEVSGESHKVSIPIPILGAITVGRKEDNTICIKDKYVSGHHFVIHCNGRRTEIEDLGSRNHTYLNGKSAHKKLFRQDDRLEIINTIFYFRENKLYIDNAFNTDITPTVVLNIPEEQLINYEDEVTVSKYDILDYEDADTISDHKFFKYEDEKTVSKYNQNYEDEDVFPTYE